MKTENYLPGIVMSNSLDFVLGKSGNVVWDQSI